ncbi:hypothetical protein D3C87_1517230 [compost metagenome]
MAQSDFQFEAVNRRLIDTRRVNDVGIAIGVHHHVITRLHTGINFNDQCDAIGISVGIERVTVEVLDRETRQQGCRTQRRRGLGGRPRDNVQGLHLRLRRDSRRDVDDAVLHLDVILCKKDIQVALGNRPLNGLANAGGSQGCGIKERIEVITGEKQFHAQRHCVAH